MFPQRKVPVVETQLEGTFKAALDKHINAALVIFILHPSSITLTVTANAYTLPPHFDQLSSGQMTQSTPTASSSHASDATKNMPNTGIHKGSSPWPKLPYIPYPGYAPAHPYYPSGVPPNETHGAPPTYAPVAPSSDVGARVRDHASKAGPDGHLPPPVADVSGGNPPPQYGPTIPHSGCLGLPPPSVAQASGSSVGEKRAAEDLEKRDAKRTKTAFGKMKDDPLFKPVLNRLGQPNGTFMCSKDGMILNPESYLQHIRTTRHLGFKQARHQCPACFKTYVRLDNCKRHYYGSECGQSAAGGPPPSFLVSEASTSSASDAPEAVPAMPFTYAHPNPTLAASMSQNTQIAPPAAHVTQPNGTPAVVDPKLGLP